MGSQESVEVDVTAMRIQALQQRLDEVASYLKGITAVVECMNRGAADSIQVATRAVEAISADLENVCHSALPDTTTRKSR
jgi:hypothetical protein